MGGSSTCERINLYAAALAMALHRRSEEFRRGTEKTR